MSDPNSFQHAWTPGGLWLNGPHQENEERLKDNQPGNEREQNGTAPSNSQSES